MADRVLPGPVDDSTCINEAVCVHTRKIFDACKDKDCVEDLRVYPTTGSQIYIDNAFSVRPRSAELLYADVDVEELSFNRGYYAVDVTYFYRVVGETFPGCHRVSGLAIFNKRVILYGSCGGAKVFTSECLGGLTPSQPIAVVEAVDPVALKMNLVDASSCAIGDTGLRDIPDCILKALGEEVVLADTGRLLYVTLGQFSIIRLERDTQLVIPVYDYCMPEKECAGSSDEDPCTVFARIDFPVNDFFPPNNPECCDCTCDASS